LQQSLLRFIATLCLQEAAAVRAREEEERRRHEAHLKKLQEELEAKKDEERK
jgi:Skp family chaperone for outer membrane proteins